MGRSAAKRPGSAMPRMIVLVGLSGAGKSTVGPLVAARLGWTFEDLDDVIEEQAGQSVAAIFDELGEEGFRALEHGATRSLAGRHDVVVASGGGWMIDPANRWALGPEGAVMTVYLRVDPEVAVTRMGSGQMLRPLLAGHRPAETLRSMLEAREAAYLQANHTVTVDSMSPDQIADTIVALATAQTPN